MAIVKKKAHKRSGHPVKAHAAHIKVKSSLVGKVKGVGGKHHPGIDKLGGSARGFKPFKHPKKG